MTMSEYEKIEAISDIARRLNRMVLCDVQSRSMARLLDATGHTDTICSLSNG